MTEIRIPVLNDEYKVIVAIGGPEFAQKVAKSYHYGHIEDYHFSDKRGLTLCRNGCFPIICLPEFPKSPEQIATLAHEAVHAIDDIFSTIHDDNRGELFAHSVGAVVRGTLSFKTKK